MAMRIGWLLLWAVARAGVAASVVPGEPGGDGLVSYRCVLTLEPPPGQSLAVEGGAVLTWNRAGRVFAARTFTREEFAGWTGGRSSLQAGQRLVFTQRQTFPRAAQAVRTAYVFRTVTGGGDRLRLVQHLALGEPTEPPPAPIGPQPRFEVLVSPDTMEGLRLGRTGRTAWGFDLWLQETNGSPVTVTAVDWTARGADGLPVAQERLDAAAVAQATGGPVQCGPDGVLVVAGRRLVPAAGRTATELLLTVAGTGENGQPVTALGRFDLRPPATRTATTRLRLPLRGVWHVWRGPGESPFLGPLAYSWLFDRLGRDGRPCAGDGSQVSSHHAYGQPVYAPAHGTVTATVDLYTDGATPVAGGLFAGATGENHLLLDHGNGERSYLAGFAQYSLAARQGQTVEAGQLLGRIGSNQGRPGLLYRLLASARGNQSEQTLEARFEGWQLVGGPQPTLPAAPEAGDQVKVP